MARSSQKQIVLTGDKLLDRKLQRLERRAANKIASNAIRGGLRIIVKAIKKEIPSSAKSARKAIGSRFERGKPGKPAAAKAGAGVGIKRTGVRPKSSKSGGVGISGSNIHWYILGTEGRTQKTTDRYTGVMPAEGAVRRGAIKSRQAVKTKMLELVRKGIAKEARKRG